MLDPGDHFDHVLKKLPLDMHTYVIKHCNLSLSLSLSRFT